MDFLAFFSIVLLDCCSIVLLNFCSIVLLEFFSMLLFASFFCKESYDLPDGLPDDIPRSRFVSPVALHYHY